MKRSLWVIVIVIAAAPLGLAGCKSDADRCLGTGWVSTEIAACEAACNDSSLKSHQQAESCYFLGKIYEAGPQLKTHDVAKAKAALAKACKLGSSSGCQTFKELNSKK